MLNYNFILSKEIVIDMRVKLETRHFQRNFFKSDVEKSTQIQEAERKHCKHAQLKHFQGSTSRDL